ncbi:hypothetical protein KQX54_001918 [Cotesia glomerata]|uniref:Uncharacterized protein n=1 Tax=Cotesia glomerata TaxID=32391 RepID=A0AAV7J3R0_COTGL|nr:hypothetical protein KQX54_001918 [Cotesia glomerata]
MFVSAVLKNIEALLEGVVNREWGNESEHRDVFRSRANTSIDIAFEEIDTRKNAVVTQIIILNESFIPSYILE